MTRSIILCAALLLAGCTNMLLPPNVAPVVAATTSVEEADRKLVSVAAQKTAIEAEFARSEQLCYEKFFVNNCLDEAREKRRVALVYQKAIDVEAQYFKRKATADQRDRDVAEAVQQFNADEARAAAAEAAPVAPAAAPASKVKPAGPSLQQRRDAQAAKVAAREARLRAEAPQRAANEKEFEERRIAAEKRQQEVAARLAKRDAKQAAPAPTPVKK